MRPHHLRNIATILVGVVLFLFVIPDLISAKSTPANLLGLALAFVYLYHTAITYGPSIINHIKENP